MDDISLEKVIVPDDKVAKKRARITEMDFDTGSAQEKIILNEALSDNLEKTSGKFVLNAEETPSTKPEIKKRKKGTIYRNGKKYTKCETNYIYYCTQGYYAYRLVDKELDVNTFVDKHFPTEKQAEKARQEHIIELSKNITFKNKNITFGALWEAMQSTLVKEESTMKKYRSVYNQHVKYEFADKKIQDITYSEVNNYLVKLYKLGDEHGTKQNGYSFSYVESILKFFWLVFNYAFAQRVLSADDLKILTDNIKMPKKEEEQDIRILTSEEIQKVYDLLKNTDFLLPFLISIYTGARPAEAFAVRFDDFDYKKKKLTIDKQIVEFDGTLTIKPPKTFSRTVDIPDALVSVAKEREELIKKAKKENPQAFECNRQKVIYKLKYKNGIDDLFEDSIMLDKKGRFTPPSSFQYYAKIIRRDICPNDYKRESFSFYTFRKTGISILASHSIPIGALMKITGHKKNDTLFKYYYSDENEFAQRKIQESVNSMNDLIKKSE